MNFIKTALMFLVSFAIWASADSSNGAIIRTYIENQSGTAVYYLRLSTTGDTWYQIEPVMMANESQKKTIWASVIYAMQNGKNLEIYYTHGSTIIYGFSVVQ
jgi:hypothetical protein